MASDDQDEARSSSTTDMVRLKDGPFVLRDLMLDVPLAADGSPDGIKINCVEYFDGNLYVGTSASELLHFVQIPSDPSDVTTSPTFILASRLEPPFSASIQSRPGVQQILLLPRVSKACVLCNYSVSFYSLPELSPVFGSTQVKNCSWVGGVDLNEVYEEYDPDDQSTAATILLSLNRRIQVVAIGENARAIKNIDIGGTTISVRRGSIACVANSGNYSLVDIFRQLQIPLMPISSLDDSLPSAEIGHAQNVSGSTDGGLLRSASAVQNRPLLSAGEAHTHSRSTSLGGFFAGRPSEERSPHETSHPSPSVTPQPSPNPAVPPPVEGGDGQTSANAPPQIQIASTAQDRTAPKLTPVFLKPHIVSPTPDEFLLVTGTGPSEPGIGMFVNLDGDPTRPTIEFERYPKEVVVDGGPVDPSSSKPALDTEEDGYVLASMSKEFEDGFHHGLEIQRWHDENGNEETLRSWLEIESNDTEQATSPLGIRSLVGSGDIPFHEVVERLSQRRFSPFTTADMNISTSSPRSTDSRTAASLERVNKERELFDRDNDTQSEDSLPEGWESNRNSEEETFARRLASARSRVAVWAGNRIWWAVRNPLLLQLEAKLDAASPEGLDFDPSKLNRWAILRCLNSFRGQDAKSEAEFVTFSYIRQKAGLLLFSNLLHPGDNPFTDPEIKALEEVLLESTLDARVVLSLVPVLRNEIIQSRKGIWVYGGVKKIAEQYLQSGSFKGVAQSLSSLDSKVMLFLRHFLVAWRKKKGFGSVPDEGEVFRTVDATLLVVLLELDQTSPQGLARSNTSIRSELYEVVDKGVDCWERAISLLESYHRLFVLSRLYQSRKMAGNVLATWKRIIEGDRDDGGELRDGEQRIREYLTKVSNQTLVQEYGIWLASRNPKLGVQVFAEDKGKASKFVPSQVVALLREEAPDAVKYYLEHLVFGKGHTFYVNDLIAYYLDIVIGELQSSVASREAFAATYTAYRALQAPKPTYQQFLTDNALEDDEVWQSRLRLLQLLSGAHDYDEPAIKKTIASLPEELLVPETIILDGRERRHEDAIRLLVHKLGDYDTAVSYCLRGGSSVYTPSSRGRSDSMPTHETQARLFRAVLGEFLTIEDVSERVEQTGALLERFGGWFEVDEVLALIPDSWAVDIVAGFLVRAVRRLVQEKHATMVTKALSSAENLRVNHDVIMKVEEKGPTIEAPQ